ncbi:hypothetical protein ANN_11917 [Periplaneta americana]|uniref:Uncharacterized protein n=1 Tax=Periplaneta americana TaxID=6978 RepID=A0ABQ8T7U4_PERAM|nr:hypothetical protein ANN_11917 [Periplaneta americana]
MMLKLIRKRKRNLLGHWLGRNCLLKDALEGMVNGKRVRGRRKYQMMTLRCMYHMWRLRGRQKIENTGECWVCSERLALGQKTMNEFYSVYWLWISTNCSSAKGMELEIVLTPSHPAISKNFVQALADENISFSDLSVCDVALSILQCLTLKDVCVNISSAIVELMPPQRHKFQFPCSVSHIKNTSSGKSLLFPPQFNVGRQVARSLMLAGNEFQSLGRAIVKEDEYEEVRWDGIVSIVSWRERVFRLWWEERRLRWAGHVARMGESRNAYRMFAGRPEEKRPLGRPRPK